MLKVLSVFGTRPEAIKMATLLQQMARRPDDFISRVCVTAQHRQMLDQVLRHFEITPDYDLSVMEDKQSPTQVMAAVLSRLEAVIHEERPDWVLVQGDTTTTAAASLAAFHAGACVGHIEAGLRTSDRWQPFPEEVNRRITSLVADLHFAPTEQARRNLLSEGVPDNCIVLTGNTVIDALRSVLRSSSLPKEIQALLRRDVRDEGPLSYANALQLMSESAEQQPQQMNSSRSKLILVTAHRRENFGRPLEQICHALKVLAARYRERIRIVYPVHPNPCVHIPVHRMLSGLSNITLLKPLDYLPMVHLMSRAYMILTDSGGLQEEAPSLGKPVLVLRELTERPEAVEMGRARVVGVETSAIVTETARLLEDEAAYREMAQAVDLYGDGLASERIIQALLDLQPPNRRDQIR
jgi:UDP-N-acetylglucosamine 2-epimerase (non-hydrolysing)